MSDTGGETVFNVTSLVKSWLAGTPNYGVMMMPTYPCSVGVSNRNQIYDESNSQFYPRLLVNYTI